MLARKSQGGIPNSVHAQRGASPPPRTPHRHCVPAGHPPTGPIRTLSRSQRRPARPPPPPPGTMCAAEAAAGRGNAPGVSREAGTSRLRASIHTAVASPCRPRNLTPANGQRRIEGGGGRVDGVGSGGGRPTRRGRHWQGDIARRPPSTVRPRRPLHHDLATARAATAGPPTAAGLPPATGTAAVAAAAAASAADTPLVSAIVSTDAATTRRAPRHRRWE